MVCQPRGLSTEEQTASASPPLRINDVLYMSHFNRLLSHSRYQKSLASVVGLSQSFDVAAVCNYHGPRWNNGHLSLWVRKGFQKMGARLENSGFLNMLA
jgi:hypothetical protein